MTRPTETFVNQPARRTARGVGVLAFVLAMHAWALYQAALGMATVPPAEVTQATLSVALLAPPAPPVAQTAAPAAPPPRPKSARAPTLPPPAPPVPEPEPPPEAAEPAEMPADPVPEPPPDEPAEETASLPTPAEPSVIEGAQALPTQGRIVYRTTYSRLRGLTALTFVDWIVDLERARYELWLRTVDPGGLLDLRSVGSLQPFGIAPERYVERIELTGRELRVDLDWSTRIVRFAGRGATAPTGFGEGAQDPLSLQFQLPLLAQAYPWRFTPGAEISFPVARRGVENYTFVVEGFEAVRIGGKDVPALKIDRKRNAEVTRRVEIWMSPEHQWLPVRLRFTDTNDEVWDNVLTQLPGPPGSEPPPEPIVQEPVKP
jgi:hypothetical protein